MVHSFLLRFLALSFTGLAMVAGAAPYTIETTDDVVAADGFCSLREAIEAISTQSAVQECPEGGTSNTISLVPGETYALTAGELVLGNSTDLISTNITVQRDGPFDDELKENAIIVGSPSARVINATAETSLTISNVTIQGGGGSVTGNGGLVLTAGRLVISDNARFEDGSADNGGALFLDGAGTSLRISQAAFTGNAAASDGGAVMTSVNFSGTVTVENSYFGENEAAASGGAWFLNSDVGAGQPGLGVQLQNSTFYGNVAADGGAIRFASTSRETVINNITVAGNDSDTNAALSFAEHDPDPSADADILQNSVVVGNIGADCSFAEDFATLAYVVSLDCGAAAGGLDFENPSLDSDNADFTVLLNDDATPCPAAEGPGACSPSTDFETGFAGFLPNSLSAGPGAAAINAGSPLTSTSFVCFPRDQRGVERADRCDSGAVEFEISRGLIDEFVLRQGVSTELDVLENDIGDNAIDCSAVFSVPVTLPLVGAPLGTPGVSDCVDMSVLPRRGSVSVNIDANGYPTLQYVSEPGFHGIDALRYRVARAAVQGATFADGDISAQVNLVVEPATGFTESETIDDLGGSAPLYMLMLSILAGLRKRARLLLAPALLVFSGQVLSADITVTTTADVFAPTNGECSLREALGNAVDFTPIFSPDCAPGATGRDTIFLPAGTFSLSQQLEVNGSLVTIEGAGVGETIIDGADSTRLFFASSGLTLRYMTLRNGASSNGGAINTSTSLTLENVELFSNEATGDGGAIFLEFNSDEVRTVRLSSVLFDGNQAAVNGGALGMIGQNENHEIDVYGSSFLGNTAVAGVGGAIDVNLQFGGALRIANSTFSTNDAASGGAALDLDDTAGTVQIMNSSFVNQASGTAEGAVDIGNSTATVRMNNSIYSNSGGCSSGSGVFSSSTRDNIFSTPRDASCLYVDELTAPTPPNSEAAPGDINTVLGGGVLVAANGTKDDFVPGHFEIDPAASGNIAYPLIVDAGATGDLQQGLTAPSNCRVDDVRGESRDAGPACDLGAYELQVATALPDAGQNRPRLDRNAIIDVLENDIAGEDARILTGSLSVTVPPSAGTASVVLRDDEEQACTSITDDCVILYESPALDCSDFDDGPFIDSFSYEFEFTYSPENDPAPTQDGTSVSGAENPGDDLVEVSIENVPPFIQGKTRYTERGVPVVFPLNVEDVDGASPPTNYKVSQEPLFAKTRVIDMPEPDEDIVTAEGVGLLINEQANTVTYIPADNTKAFDDAFAIEVEDECGKTAAATFFVRYDVEDTSGGELLGSGGHYPLAAILIALVAGLRRRFALS